MKKDDYSWWKWNYSQFAYAKAYHFKQTGIEVPPTAEGAQHIVHWWKDQELADPDPRYEYGPGDMKPDNGWYNKMRDTVCNAIIKG